MTDLSNTDLNEPILDGATKIDDADFEKVSGGKKKSNAWICPKCNKRNFMGDACEKCGYKK